MSQAGVTTPTLPFATVLDAVLGNHNGTTAQMRMDDLISYITARMGPSYGTLAELNADLDWADGSLGAVWSDATEANRGIYAKTGASGAGSWSRIGDLPVSALSQAALNAKAGKTFVDALHKRSAQLSQWKGVSHSGAVSFDTGGNLNIAAGGYYLLDVDLTASQIAAGKATIYFQTVDDLPLDTASWVHQRADGGSVISGSQVTFDALANGHGKLDMILDASATHLRIRIDAPASAACKVFGPSVIDGYPAHREADAVAMALNAWTLTEGDADQAENIWAPAGFNGISGPTGSGLSGLDVSLVADAIGEINVPVEGVVTQTDTVGFLCQITGGVPKLMTLVPSTGQAGGTGSNVLTLSKLHGNWYWGVSAPCEAGSSGGLDPLRLTLRVENTAIRSGIPTADITLSNIWMGKNVTAPPSRVRTPAYVRSALSLAGVSTIYVDPDGDNANSGTLANPVADLHTAVARGASRIGLATKQHKLTAPVSLSALASLEMFNYQQAGSAQVHAVLDWSVDHVPGDFVATAADTGVLYMAMATDPKAVWEQANGVKVRLGKSDPNRPMRIIMNTSEVEVRAAAGSAWYGAGSEGIGLYIRPYQDTTAGKTFHTPSVDTAFTGSSIGHFKMTGVSMQFAREPLAQLTRVNFEHKHCQYLHSARSVALQFLTNAQSTSTGQSNEFFDNGEDGMGINGAIRMSESGSIFRDNGGDGISPHFDDNDVSLLNCQLLDNAKQGFVTIGNGTFRLHGNICRGNGDRDIYASVGGTEKLDIEMIGNHADDALIRHNGDPSLPNVHIYDHSGSIAMECDAVIRGHRCRDSTVAFALRLDRNASVDLADFNYQQNINGVALASGTLTAKQGHILRNTTGINQTGGTLSLDAADPINVNGNGNDFSGVDAAEQAKAQSFAAI